MSGHVAPTPTREGLSGDVHRHGVRFYEEDASLCAAVAEVIARGLRAGEAVLVIGTREHRSAFLDRVDGPDVAAALASGQLVCLDAHETLAAILEDGAVSATRLEATLGTVIRAAAEKWGRVCAHGEMVDLLWRRGQQAVALELELLWNDVVDTNALSLLCAYSMESFRDASQREPFQRLCAAHTHVTPTEAYTGIAHPDAQLREIAALQQRACALEAEVERRQRLELELRASLDRERAANGAKDELLAMLGHELRNPLSPILTAIELIRLRVGDAAGRECEIIARQAEHLVTIVDDLLDVSRITRGKIELERCRVCIRAVVERAVERTATAIDRRSHRLTTSVPPDLWVEGDEHRLVQVVENLLTNAAKYTSPGGDIEVSARRTRAEVELRVRDTGMGISPELLPRIFDTFKQGMRKSDRAEGGLGLGLAIVRALVEMHGGRVSAQSAGAGKGSELFVRLPLAPEVAPVEPNASSSPSVAALRVLVVDDNIDAMQLLVDALRARGHDAVAAHDGPSALAEARLLRPEVAFLDIGLPAMDGYELGARLRQLPGLESLRLVALTGYGQSADRQRSKAAGFDAHLVKPATLGELERTLERVVASPRD